MREPQKQKKVEVPSLSPYPSGFVFFWPSSVTLGHYLAFLAAPLAVPLPTPLHPFAHQPPPASRLFFSVCPFFIYLFFFLLRLGPPQSPPPIASPRTHIFFCSVKPPLWLPQSFPPALRAPTATGRLTLTTGDAPLPALLL